jgi:hypothetical protein
MKSDLSVSQPQWEVMSLLQRHIGVVILVVALLVSGFRLSAQSLALNVPQSGGEGTTLAAAGTILTDVNTNQFPLTVYLFSFDTDRVLVPPFVLIPPGTNTAHFDLILVENGLIHLDSNVVIEALLEDVASDLDVIRVTDNESRTLAITVPAQVVEGQGMLTNAGMVTFFGVPAADLVMALQSSHPELISVPPFVTHSAGQTGTWFHLTVKNDAVTNGLNSVRIIASASGFLTTTSVVHCIDDEPFIPSSSTPADFATSVPLMTILRWKTSSMATPGAVYDVYFGSSPALGEAELLGSTTTRFWVLPALVPGSTYYWQVRVRIAGVIAGPVWRFTTRGVDRFEFDPVNSPQLAGEYFTTTITARDELNRVVTNFAGSVALSVLTDGNGVSGTLLSGSSQISGSAAAGRTVGYSFTPSTNITVTAVRHFFGGKVSIWTDAGELLAEQPVASTPITWMETPLNTPLALTAGVRYRVTCYSPNEAQRYQTNAASNFTFGTIHQSYTVLADGFPTNATSERWWLVDLRYSVPVSVTPKSIDDFTNGVWSDDVSVIEPAAALVLMARDAAGPRGMSTAFRVLPRNQPLTFLTQPQGRIVGLAAPFSLAVTVEGLQPISYQWRRNGIPITDNDRRTGTTGPVLTISNAEDNDTGVYSVLVSNPFTNVVSAGASLEVGWVDHFVWSLVPSPQLPNVPFAVTVEARDYFDQTITNFDAWVTLSSTASGAAPPIPTTPIFFEDGVWSSFITLTNPTTNLILRVEFDGRSAVSQPIDIVPPGQPPIIWNQPASRAVRPGSNATVVVKVFGSGPITYQWRRAGTPLSDGGRLSGATSSTLLISDFQQSDVAPYSVIASNELGVATSTNATLTLDLMERFDWLFPGAQQKIIGQPFIASIRALNASGQVVTSAAGPVAWSGMGDGGVMATPILNGSYTNGVWSGTMTITKPVTNLVLRADDGFGRFGLSPMLQITPTNLAPLLISAPSNLTLRVGETARFHALAYGAPTLNYSWMTNNFVIQPGSRFSGQGTTTFVISNVVESDSKTYSITMANGLGPAINLSATLAVFRQHHFTWGSIPSPQSIFRPIPVRLEARDAANQLVTNFTGSVNLSAALAGSGVPVIISPTTATNFVAGVWNGSVTVDEPLSGVVLRAEDAFGNVGFTAPFDTEQIVAITLQPTNQFVLPGTNVTLVAEAAGTGFVRFQWRFDGTNLPGATNTSFSFTNANLTNYHGNFSVVATDDLGSITSSNAFIYVLVRPGIVTAPRPQTVLEGETAIFTCVATGAPPLAYRWISNSATFMTSAVPFLIVSNAQPRVPPQTFRVIVQNVAGSTTGGASTNVALIVLADHDRDGLADAWEVLYGFNTNNAADALLDPDGDTLNNRAEYLSGTDPTNAASVLHLALNETNPGLLQFIAQSNIAYRVEYRTNLASDSWSTFTSLAAQAYQRTAQVSVPYPPLVPARYYRIVTLPAP